MWKESFVERLVQEWNENNEKLFQVNPRDVYWNLSSQNLLNYQLEEISGVPVLSATAADEGVKLGIQKETYWISLWGSVSPARAEGFLLDVQSNAKLLEKKKVSFGADEFHFVPGMPQGGSAWGPLLQALDKNGYEGRPVFDYVGSLENSKLAAYCELAATTTVEKRFQIGVASTSSDLKMLEEFLAKEFPGRWLREFQYWENSQRENAQKSVVDWMILCDQMNELLGFARIGYGTKANSGAQVPGNLRLWQDNSEAIATSLGPIGSSKHARGMGVGSCLLGVSLERLRSVGGKVICIDWTEDHLDRFYLPLGLTKGRQFLCRNKVISS